MEWRTRVNECHSNWQTECSLTVCDGYWGSHFRRGCLGDLKRVQKQKKTNLNQIPVGVLFSTNNEIHEGSSQPARYDSITLDEREIGHGMVNEYLHSTTSGRSPLGWISYDRLFSGPILGVSILYLKIAEAVISFSPSDTT